MDRSKEKSWITISKNIQINYKEIITSLLLIANLLIDEILLFKDNCDYKFVIFRNVFLINVIFSFFIFLINIHKKYEWSTNKTGLKIYDLNENKIIHTDIALYIVRHGIRIDEKISEFDDYVKSIYINNDQKKDYTKKIQ